MGTEGARIVLLLVSLSVAAASSPSPICQRPAFSIMSRLRRCTMNYMREMPALRAIIDSEQHPTKSQLMTFLHAYCTQAIPAGLTCFQEKISGCNATLRATFSQLAEDGVGIMCLPRAEGPDPAMVTLLDSISDEGLELFLDGNRGCPGLDVEENPCRRRIQRLPDPKQLSLDKLSPWMQKVIGMYMRCTLDFFREEKNSCPHWRTAYLAEVEFLLTWPVLGVRMPFTAEELVEKLEI